MFKILTTVLILFSLSASAQTITRDASGNFHEAPSAKAAPHDSTTTFTYTYERGGEAITTPVYVGPKGGLYVWKLVGVMPHLRKVYLPKPE